MRMREFEARFGELVLRFRWTVIIATLILVGLAASGGQFLKFTNDYRIFFSEDNPQLLAFEALENTFSKNDNVMFVLAPKSGEVFSRRNLTAVEWLTKEAWQTPYSTKVDSISNFQHTQAQADDLMVGDLISDAHSLSDQELNKIREIALSEPILRQRLISPKADVTAINITVQMPGIDESVETPKVMSHVRNLVEQLNNRYPDIDVHTTGVVLLNNAFSESSVNDLQTLIPISFAAMVIFLVLLLRGFTGTAATVVVIAFSILTAMGIGGWIGYPISPPSATAPTIILTMAIANCVHVLVTFLHQYRVGQSKDDSLKESLRINLQPVFLASLTTALGFLSMNFSEVPPFQHLGNFVAFGVAAAFLYSVTFLPAFVSLLPVRAKLNKQVNDPLMEKFGDFVIRRQTWLLWSMSAVVIVLIASLPRNELNDIFVQYFDESTQFRRDADFTSENLTGLYVIDYALDSGETSGISKPEFLKELAAFANWYRDQAETKHVSVLTDIMTRLNKNMHGDDPEWYRLPESRNLAAQYLLLYEMSLPYGLDLNSQIEVDNASTRMTVSIETISSNAVIALEQRAKDWLSANAPNIKSATATGTTLMFSHIGKRNIVSMLVGTTIALLLISMILIVALRSLKIGLVSIVPNLVPGAMGFGLWGLMVGQVGLALSVVTGMTLGIVVDDTVHFLSKYLRARREKNYAPPEAVRYAFTTVGRALIITSIVLISGFLVLATSHFKLNAEMGLLTAIVIAFALIADFLLLPTLLMKIEEKQNEKLAVVDTATGTTTG